jgi:hypothetical protein
VFVLTAARAELLLDVDREGRRPFGFSLERSARPAIRSAFLDISSKIRPLPPRCKPRLPSSDRSVILQRRDISLAVIPSDCPARPKGYLVGEPVHRHGRTQVMEVVGELTVCGSRSRSCCSSCRGRCEGAAQRSLIDTEALGQDGVALSLCCGETKGDLAIARPESHQNVISPRWRVQGSDRSRNRP